LLEGFLAGGVTDLASRTIAERMGRELGQTVLVENRPGAAVPVALTALSPGTAGWLHPGGRHEYARHRPDLAAHPDRA